MEFTHYDWFLDAREYGEDEEEEDLSGKAHSSFGLTAAVRLRRAFSQVVPSLGSSSVMDFMHLLRDRFIVRHSNDDDVEDDDDYEDNDEDYEDAEYVPSGFMDRDDDDDDDDNDNDDDEDDNNFEEGEDDGMDCDGAAVLKTIDGESENLEVDVDGAELD